MEGIQRCQRAIDVDLMLSMLLSCTLFWTNSRVTGVSYPTTLMWCHCNLNSRRPFSVNMQISFIFLLAIPLMLYNTNLEQVEFGLVDVCSKSPNSKRNVFRCDQFHVIGFNHGLPCYVKNMALGTQVDKNRGRRPRFLSWLRPEGQVFNIAWQTMIKTYYSMSPFAI